MKIVLRDVRAIFINVFDTAKFQGTDTGKYDATFMLCKTKHSDLIKEIKNTIKNISNSKFKRMLPADKLCLKDGDDTGHKNTIGFYLLKASNKIQPIVIDENKQFINEDDQKASLFDGRTGNTFNAVIVLWCQNNNYGKRINAELKVIQFHNHGDFEYENITNESCLNDLNSDLDLGLDETDKLNVID